MAELRTGEIDAVSEEPEVITISDDEVPPESTGDDKPISAILEEFKTLIQPVPKDKGDTFNRAEYQVSPLLTKRTEECNKVITEFLDACIPHLRKKDLRYILERLKSLLCQTNLHYLASHGFQRYVVQMTRSIQANSSATYVHLKDLTDELRAHREKKPKEKAEEPHNSAPPLAANPEADSQASTSGVAGSSNQNNAAAVPVCSQCLSKIDAANKLPAAETSGSRRNPSGPRSPLSASSSTAAQIPKSSALPSPRISVGEQPGTSGLAGRVGNRRRDSRQVEREVREQRQRNRVGRLQERNGLQERSGLQETNGPSRRDSQNIAKLQEYLLELCRNINKLREEEVDLNEDDEASAYIQEDRLKKRAWNIWHKICRLEGRRPKTGTQQEKQFKFTGTPYPAINAAVERLVNKKIFPDFTDICNVVKRVNEQEDLGLDTRETQTIAEKAFTSVGQELQRRRQADELSNVMAYLGSCSDYGHDPAESDPVLMAKLEESAKEYRKRMDDVIQTYVNKQQELKLEPQEVKEEDCDRSPEPDGNNSSEDEEDDEEQNDSIEDGVKNREKDLLVNGSLSEGEQGAKEEVREVCKPLCAPSSSASLAGEQGAKEEAGDVCKPLCAASSSASLEGEQDAKEEAEVCKPLCAASSSASLAGEQGAKEEAGEVCKPLCAASSSVSLAGEQGAKEEAGEVCKPLCAASSSASLAGVQGAKEEAGEVCNPLCAASSSASLAGEQGAKEEAEVWKPLCAPSSSASLAGKESSKSSVAEDELGLAPTDDPNSAAVAEDGLGLAPTYDPNSAAQHSIKPILGGPASSEPSRDSSGIVQLNNSSVCGSSAAADVIITPVPVTKGTSELTVTAVPAASGSTQLTITPVPIASGTAELSVSLATGGEQKYGTKNGTIVLPEVSIFPVQSDKLTPGPKDGVNGQKLLGKRQRCSSEKEHEGDIIMIPSDDDEVSAPPVKTFKC